MCSDISVQRNVILDQILAERRTHRKFRPEPCSDEEIRRILHAGLLAPFAATSAGSSRNYFRRFFVMRRGSSAMDAAVPVLVRQVRMMAADLEERMRGDTKFRAEAAAFARRLAMIRDAGAIPGVGSAPVYIVVAERKEYPYAQPQSLAHCLENMWLKATALDLGFQPVSITSEMSSDPDFCAILGLAPGAWELAGCAVGYAADEL